jgi:hypothetical protein
MSSVTRVVRYHYWNNNPGKMRQRNLDPGCVGADSSLPT